MKNLLLKKIIAISFFLAIAFIIEYIVSFSFGIHCYFSLLKIELLPILSIGFLFGLKFSFFSTLFYILIHSLLEFVFSFHKHDLILVNNDVFSLFFAFSLLLYIFIIPYLSCVITGFFYRKDLKHLNYYRNVIQSLSLITLIQIVSYFIFALIIHFFYSNSFNEFLEHFPKTILKISGEGFSLAFFIFLFYLISVIITNIILGIIFYFLNPILKENIEFFLSE
ncbi:hypothetical protein [Candidatus Phytoplasma pini]|uniref:Uncharacterized protein n=1 Tax=Candidatus Phytoplasma pini TaxID=267362 RepID=A0A559KJF4_9MOLU|nr:hypothetical protein [Candidatus Phytoplasma pini]TVY12261.1 hypothetical protein MDPP_00208 [Candidatus Phytoplasma pini]